MTENTNEVWRLYPVMRLHCHSTREYSQMVPQFLERVEFVLVGFHALTKEKLHEYGPFESRSQVADFMKAHNIQLETL